MDPALHAIAAALAELDDAELHALIAATNGASHTAPGLLASLDGIPQMPPHLLAWPMVLQSHRADPDNLIGWSFGALDFRRFRTDRKPRQTCTCGA